MISIALDGSEHYLINTKFRDIVEEELFEWRKSRLKSFKILKKQMIPPQEKTWKKLNDTLVISVDEGKGLYDDDIIDVEMFQMKYMMFLITLILVWKLMLLKLLKLHVRI